MILRLTLNPFPQTLNILTNNITLYPPIQLHSIPNPSLQTFIFLDNPEPPLHIFTFHPVIQTATHLISQMCCVLRAYERWGGLTGMGFVFKVY